MAEVGRGMPESSRTNEVFVGSYKRSAQDSSKRINNKIDVNEKLRGNNMRTETNDSRTLELYASRKLYLSCVNKTMFHHCHSHVVQYYIR